MKVTAGPDLRHRQLFAMEEEMKKEELEQKVRRQVKVVGIGNNKTGTSTLGTALRQVGIAPISNAKPIFAHYWQNKNELDINRIINYSKKISGFQDFPWNFSNIYKYLDAFYPNAKFILTMRDSDKWYDSVYRWCINPNTGQSDLLYNMSRRPKPNRFLNNMWTVDAWIKILKIKYNVKPSNGVILVSKNKKKLISAYEARNNEILSYFEGNDDKLLVINWEENDGWKELCDFLSVRIPGCKFPHRRKNTKYLKGYK